jgi:hypothetical protein
VTRGRWRAGRIMVRLLPAWRYGTLRDTQERELTAIRREFSLIEALRARTILYSVGEIC